MAARHMPRESPARPERLASMAAIAGEPLVPAEQLLVLSVEREGRTPLESNLLASCKHHQVLDYTPDVGLACSLGSTDSRRRVSIPQQLLGPEKPRGADHHCEPALLILDDLADRTARRERVEFDPSAPRHTVLVEASEGSRGADGSPRRGRPAHPAPLRRLRRAHHQLGSWPSPTDARRVLSVNAMSTNLAERGVTSCHDDGA